MQINILLNNAGVSKGRDGTVGTPFENLSAWKDVLEVNLGGVRSFSRYGFNHPAYLLEQNLTFIFPKSLYTT